MPEYDAGYGDEGAYLKFLINAFDAPLFLIKHDANFEEYFERMESYALHHMDYFEPIKFSHQVVDFFTGLSSIEEFDANYASHALMAIKI